MCYGTKCAQFFITAAVSLHALRFGEVVSLLTDMTAAGLSPNLNTYRILINACQRAGQAGLAFQIFALMHGNKIKVLQEVSGCLPACLRGVLHNNPAQTYATQALTWGRYAMISAEICSDYLLHVD